MGTCYTCYINSRAVTPIHPDPPSFESCVLVYWIGRHILTGCTDVIKYYRVWPLSEIDQDKTSHE